jgi:predicted SAM-dependent methyltransferase
LGPGQEKYIPGWINVDANLLTAKIDVWANLLDPLPFHDGSVDCVYSHHVIEHFPDSHLPDHFRQLARCLKDGGAVRIGGPHAQSAALKLLEADGSWFSDFPDRRTSVGGRFANFLLCRGEHPSDSQLRPRVA